ncbi:MAG: hypothetical protein PHQ86_05515 [Dehalococcoidales bacterium]|nr:hypothetical protein [Dehalococcoidales bacterium]
MRCWYCDSTETDENKVKEVEVIDDIVIITSEWCCNHCETYFTVRSRYHLGNHIDDQTFM